MANVSKVERLRRPPKPEFSLVGILIGTFAGEALAVVAEVAVTGPNRWVMLAGGAAGALLGAAFEGARYGQIKRRWEAFRISKTNPPAGVENVSKTTMTSKPDHNNGTP